MERRHFKLAQGYLNIDAQAVIFTRSGNWQEAEQAPESTTRTKVASLPRLIVGSVLIIGGGLFFSIGKSRYLDGAGAGILALGLMCFGIFKMYDLLRDDLISSYRIPFPKVKDLRYANDHLEIDFLDGDFKDRQISLVVPGEAALFAQEAWQSHREGDPRRG